MSIAASDYRQVTMPFDVEMEVIDVEGDQAMPAILRYRRFAIDGSVLLVMESYDDGVVAVALTKEQAKLVGLWLSA